MGEGLLPEPQYGGSRTPILWMSTNPLDGEMWAELVSAFTKTGLWPLVLDNLEPERPWRGGEFGGDGFGANPDAWEDRFGAYTVRLGFAEVFLSVARPPTDLSEARLVALEHYAWCPTLDEHGVDIEEYATSLLDSNSWGCWWD